MSECIPWTGTINSHGYGTSGRANTWKSAHREAYIAAKGPIPDGYVIDHVCHNEAAARGECEGESKCLHRRCVNPEHLEAVTHQENTRRGLNGYATRTHCKSGRHDITDPGSWVTGGHGRQCRECARISSMEGKRRRRAEAKARMAGLPVEGESK